MKKWAVISLFIMASALRFINLGYSDYQGDEIKALYNPREDNSVQFFLEQRKGPMQFVFTAALKTLTQDYRNRALVRFPFALAGFGSVIIFYLVAQELFNGKIAFYSTTFFATNGFFIAFSRIVQYQSLVIFFGLLAIYLVVRYCKYLRVRHIIWASLCLSLSLLSHYDGVFFIPIILGLLINKLLALKDRNSRITLLKQFSLSLLILLILTGLFYIPFVLNIAKSTTDYWAGRISGDVSSKNSSSHYLFKVYQPIYAAQIYILLGMLGLIITFFGAVSKLLTTPPKGKTGFIHNIITFGASHHRFSIPVIFSLLTWFLVPFIVMEVLIYVPGTHIYTYLLPVFLLMGLAMSHIEFSIGRYLKKIIPIFLLGTTSLILFLSLQSYLVFIDHNPEYPWENKPFLLWTLPKPTPIFHLSIFGFPYYRHWEEIGDYIKEDRQADYYSSNERTSISRHHIDITKDGDLAGYYVLIHNPQTFTNYISSDRLLAWMPNHDPVRIYQNGPRTVSKVYLIK